MGTVKETLIIILAIKRKIQEYKNPSESNMYYEGNEGLNLEGAKSGMKQRKC